MFPQGTASGGMSGLSPDGRLDGAARYTEGTHQQSFVSASARPRAATQERPALAQLDTTAWTKASTWISTVSRQGTGLLASLRISGSSVQASATWSIPSRCCKS